MSVVARFTHPSRVLILCLAVGLHVVGCGERQPAQSADDAAESEDVGSKSSEAEPVSRPAAARDNSEGSDEGSESDVKKPSGAEPAEPTFTENMSVDEAVKAVPSGYERRNIDPEDLGKPLQESSVYEPCKPGSARVKLRVAIWEGRAVGVDVSTTPKNEKLAECIKGRIRELKWNARVKSINTVDYQL